MKDQVRTPLRTVLRNFLNHIEKLESSSSPEKSYDAEFQDLKLFSESVKSSKEYACTEGEKETNKKKNRYKDILPFDVSRVILNEYAGIPGSDYINANYIKGASGSPAYIASQGPLPCTVNDFWRMVVQCEVQVIVMACNEEEAGKVYYKAKCEKYWVDEGEEKQFGMISVKLLKASTVCPDFSVRTMRLKYTNSQNVVEERTVCQLHYVAWPDHGVPTVVQPLLEMVRLVRDTQASETLPVLVHCSAGCGRTGTICAIDYVWGLLRTGKLTDDFSLLALIREMRKQRIAMVQTKEQYVLVHQAVRELFKEQLLMIDSHPYENVDPDGLLIIKEEENHYDTVENFTNINFEEKKDNTMEKDVAPPLPQKKHTFYPSKQEKDVENLSAQQRSITHSAKKKSQNVSSPCARSSLGGSLSFDTSQQLSQSTQKKVPNPIPSKGILRVPHLKSISSASPIKRSKSLKLTNSAVKLKMVVNPDIPIELKRRGSLESNLDETGSILDDAGYNTISVDETLSTKDDTSSSSIHNSPCSTHKYDVLNYLEEKRLLVRSLTTFDLRQKNMSLSVRVEEGPSTCPPVSKCRLSRSNTQVEFSRHLGGRSTNKRIELGNDSSPSSVMRKYNTSEQSPFTVFTSKREGNESKLPERQYKSAMKRMDDIHGIYGHNTGKSESKHQSCFSPKESYKSSQLSRIEMPTHLITQSKDLNPKNCNGSVSKQTHTEQHPSPSFRQMAVPYNDPKIGNVPNNVKNPRFKDMLYSNYASPSTSHNLEGRKFKQTVMNKHSISPQYHVPINDGHNKFSYLNGSPMIAPIKYDLRVSKSSDHPDSKVVYKSQSHNSKDSSGPMLKKTELRTVPVQHGYNCGPHSNRKVPAQASPQYTFQEKTALIRKQLEHNNARLIKHGTYSPRENEDRYGIDKETVQTPSLSKPALDIEKSNPKMNSSPTGRMWPPPYRLSELGEDKITVELNDEISNLKIHLDHSAQKCPGSSSGRLDVPTPQEVSDMKNCDYFSNAPGVDLDQVAASIPRKDASKTNLMKVTLEAFSIRRSRQQARLPDPAPPASSSPKGSSPSTTGGSKRKQQQYL